MGSKDDYQAMWRKYRRLRVLGLLFTFGGFVVAAGVSWSVHAILGREPKVITTVLGLAWFVPSVVLLFRSSFFSCPRCHERFAWNWFRRNEFTSKCLHCGLRIGEDPSEE